MKKTALLSIALLALACGAALAAGSQLAAPTPQSPAMAAILAGTSGPPAGAQYVFINHCEPPTRFVCVNKSCQCTQLCGSRGVQSFTCDSTTGASSCVCNP